MKKKLRKNIASYLNMDKNCKAVLKTAFATLPDNPPTNLVVEIINEYFLNVKGFISHDYVRNWKISHHANNS